MTIVRADARGIEVASAALRRGEPVCVPMPAPLPYAVAARTAAAVNEAKGRPGDQPVGMAIAGIDVVASFLDLDDATLAYAEWLSAVQGISVMLPVSEAVPGWAAGSTARGFVAVTLAWLPGLAPLLDRAGYLFVSSGNATGGSAAVTAAGADAEFGGRILVVDGDRYRDGGSEAGSASIVRLRRGLETELVRPGIQNTTRTVPPDQFLASLAAQWREADA